MTVMLGKLAWVLDYRMILVMQDSRFPSSDDQQLVPEIPLRWSRPCSWRAKSESKQLRRPRRIIFELGRDFLAALAKKLR